MNQKQITHNYIIIITTVVVIHIRPTRGIIMLHMQRFVDR